MEKNKLVVIFTLNYNQSKMTLECVDSILNSNYTNYNLIVVDNGSTNEEYQYLLDNINSKVSVERINENCGYVGGINRGLHKAASLNPDYFLIMNNDTIIDPEAIKYLVEAGERYDKNAIISGKVYHYDRPDVFQYVGGIFKDKRYLMMNNIHKDELDEGQCEVEKEMDMLDDIFWLLPNKIVKNVGKYSKHFFLYAEQADYARRVSDSGYILIYTPKAKIWHKGSITTGDGNRFAPHVNYWRKKGSIIYRAKHLEKKTFWIYSVKLLIKLMFKSVGYMLFGKNELSKANLAALRGVISGIKWNFNKVEDKGYNPYL